MKLMDIDISNQYTAEVIANTRLTPEESEAEVRDLVLEVSDPTFHVVEGQSIGVLVSGPHPFGNDAHLRLYSVAGVERDAARHGVSIAICVRRCFYIDTVSGERYPGIASNFLCDRRPGDPITITGPYGRHFVAPRDPESNLLMIGAGTGIAPFRAFLKSIYKERGAWKGQVRLFYGAKTGMELLYMNERQNDFAQYYDESTFKAFEALSPRPHFDEPPALEQVFAEHKAEIWKLLKAPKTCVYVAGLEQAKEKFDEFLAKAAGSEEKWDKMKAEIVADGRWSELLY